MKRYGLYLLLSVSLLLTGCPFSISNTVLVYFELLLSTADAEGHYSVDLWTSGSVLYGMVDGQVIDGFEALLSEESDVLGLIKTGQLFLAGNVELLEELPKLWKGPRSPLTVRAEQ